MERVLDEIEVLLPVLGFDVLQPAATEPAPGPGVAATTPTFVADIGRAKAHAVERGGEFVVLAGSTARRQETDAIPPSVKQARKALIDAKVLVEDTDVELYRFAQDSSFGSPSGASAAIAGRADNGKTTWRVESDGRNYAAWRAGLIGDEEGQRP
jgi:hypothetical protein